jgi:hypothetical protein
MPKILRAEAEHHDAGINRAQRRARALSERRQRRGYKESEPKIRPALISIVNAAEHLDVARSTFYKKFLPDLETVRIGARRLVVMESLDRLIETLREQGSV